jgi:hypothetical protein
MHLKMKIKEPKIQKERTKDAKVSIPPWTIANPVVAANNVNKPVVAVIAEKIAIGSAEEAMMATRKTFRY